VTGEARGTDTKAFTWDAGGRLVEATVTRAVAGGGAATENIEYRYDHVGRRVSKTTSLGTWEYLWGEDGLVEEWLPSGLRLAYERAGGLVTAVRAHDLSGIAAHERLLHDGLGSVVGRVKLDGAAVSYRYDAWGSFRGGTPTASEPSLAYAGQHWDEDVGLSYAQQRWYEPGVGRFLSEDPIFGDLTSPNSLHAFGYAYANPLLFTDPSGMAPPGFGYSGAPSAQEILRANPNSQIRKKCLENLKNARANERAYGELAARQMGWFWGAVVETGYDLPIGVYAMACMPWTLPEAAHGVTTLSDRAQEAGEGLVSAPVGSPAFWIHFGECTQVGVEIYGLTAGARGGMRGAPPLLAPATDIAVDCGVGRGVLAASKAGELRAPFPFVFFNEKNGDGDVGDEGTRPSTASAPNANPPDPSQKVVTQFGKKIEKQIGKRGWTKESVQTTIENPSRTVQTADTRHLADGTRLNDPATAYINQDGSYVVRNNRSGDVVQVSNRNDPSWKSPFE
jgi:RHS repeat-associated protein